VPFDPQYVAHVLRDNFEDAKTLFLDALIAIHYAHLVMLAECRIISGEDAHALRGALDSLDVDATRRAPFDGRSEDLFFHVERSLAAACGEATAGRLHTARSRNDIDMTMYRMRQREFVAALSGAVLELREVLLGQAGRHRTTVFAALTHTQPAQPTTIAHYLLAVVEQLERDQRRLQSAYASTNCCPLGSCAITGTGFPIDRQRTSELLGFAAPTGNTYGSIATVDYLLESVSATTTLMVGLGRVLQDLLLWCTADVGYLRLADGFVQCSSIMPQKRNPVALEHARALGSKAVGQGQAVALAVHNTPFGDIVDTEDDVQPLVAGVFRDATRAVMLVAAAMRDAEFDVSRLEARAASDGTTLTELADHLVRAHGMPFKTAHAIAARLFAVRRADPSAPLAATLADVSAGVLGDALRYTDAELDRILSAHHFIEVRTTPGGPAPSETSRAIEASRAKWSADQAWLEGRRAALAAAERRLHDRASAL
jgi:argininosuccinate lyase